MGRLVETADDTTDQIAVVERPEVDAGTIGYRLQPGDYFGESALGIATERLRRLDGYRGQTQGIAGPPLSDNRQVRRNDRGDLWIAAGRLMICEQQNRLSRPGHLDGTGHDCIRDDIPAAAMLQHGAIEAHAHPVSAL